MTSSSLDEMPSLQIVLDWLSIQESISNLVSNHIKTSLLLFASHKDKGLAHSFGISHSAKLVQTSKEDGLFVSFGLIIASFV